MIAVAHGARVVAVDTSLEAMEKAVQLGAVGTIDANQSQKAIREAVSELTEGSWRMLRLTRRDSKRRARPQFGARDEVAG